MKSVNGSGLKRAALINDLSCFGKCSLSVALPILSSFGVEAVPLPTAILSTHTAGFEGYVVRDMTAEMKAFADHWQTFGLQFDCIATGFFCSVEQIRFARRFIEAFRGDHTLVVVDPVLGDNGKLYGCFSPDFVAEMRLLTQMADVITPNHTEAALLADLPCDTPDETLLEHIPGKCRVITSAAQGDQIGYLARFGGQSVRVEKKRLDLALHGAGDVFTSALCGELLIGQLPETALRSAADFCDRCVRATAARQPAHWYGLCFEDELRRRRI